MCSTILPCIFALVGFMSAVFLTRFESMEPLELGLSNYNPDFEDATRLPTPFNKGGSFPCQPASCVSFYDEYLDSYCGLNPFVLNKTCEGTDVADIVDSMEEGLYIIDQNVSTVEEVCLWVNFCNSV